MEKLRHMEIKWIAQESYNWFDDESAPFSGLVS